MRRSWLPLALAAALVAGCATVVNPVTGEAERTVMDEPTEIAEGAKAHQQVLTEYGVYPNTKLQAYVNDLGQRLARSSHRANLTWTFTVLDSPEVNAFALPGGYVYVTRGIMAYLDSEADLAGVIGHEIGHVTARHGAQRATRQQTAGIGVFAASVLGAVLGVGDLASQVSQSVAAGYIASYSRDQETQADRLGAEYLARNRLDPEHMVGVIGVLKAQELFAIDEAKAQGRAAPQGGDWLASHPSNDQRLQDLRAIVGAYKGPYDEEGRERYLKAMDGVTFGDSAQQGLVRGRNFFHEPLGIALSAPPGWQVKNGAEAITLVNATGDAGLIVQLVPPAKGAKSAGTHEDIIRQVIQPVQGQVEKRSLNGLPATHFVGVRQTAQGQQQRVTATIVSGPKDQAYVMLYAAKDAAALQRNAAGLREAEASFRALTAADRSAAKPWTVQVVPYPKGGFAALAQRSSLPAAGAERELRLINGFYGGGEPKPGQVVKVVE